MSRLETIEEGISLTEKRLKNIPDFDIYKSILTFFVVFHKCNYLKL